MKNLKYFLVAAAVAGLFTACGKSDSASGSTVVNGVKETTVTDNGVTYKLFVSSSGSTNFKGILVMGAGNDENNPTVGSINDGASSEICEKAAAGGYVAAIVAYRKTPGLADWNGSAQIIAQDFSGTVTSIANTYKLDKTKSVVGGFSYASFMLLTDDAYYHDIDFCKGVLAPCGATGATDFHIPFYAIACSGDNEGDWSGADLYAHLNPNSAVRAQSAGVTDNSCSTHCGGDWTTQLYTRLTYWLP